MYPFQHLPWGPGVAPGLARGDLRWRRDTRAGPRKGASRTRLRARATLRVRGQGWEGQGWEGARLLEVEAAPAGVLAQQRHLARQLGARAHL